MQSIRWYQSLIPKYIQYPCFIIGWRGAPGQDDEPQHVEKERLQKLHLSYWILNI